VPSPVLYTGEAKKALVERYLRTLKERPCEYYSKFRDCPFGRHCFYRHEGEHGCKLDWSHTTRHGEPRLTWEEAEMRDVLRSLYDAIGLPPAVPGSEDESLFFELLGWSTRRPGPRGRWDGRGRGRGHRRRGGAPQHSLVVELLAPHELATDAW